MNVAVLEVCHKPYRQSRADCLVPVHAGRAVAAERSKDGTLDASDLAWLRANATGDDTGENISAMNRNLNEFTALYWAWKNQSALGNPQYLGLVHYRRHFVVDFDPKGRTYGDVLGLTAEKVRACVDRCGTCCRFFCRTAAGSVADKLKAGEWGTGAWPYFERACEIIRRRSEEDFRWVEETVNGHETGGLCSMFLMKNDVFDAYCGWLLPVLVELHESIDWKTVPWAEQRAAGWCGEILTSVWLHHHAKSHPVRELPVFCQDGVAKRISAFRYARRKLSERFLGRTPAPDDDKTLVYEICHRLNRLGIGNEITGGGDGRR